MNKTFKYRIYPTQEQSAKMEDWLSIQRFLHNHMQEKCLEGLNKEIKVYPNKGKLCKGLTNLRKEYDWIKKVPRHTESYIVHNLCDAWDKCFKKKALAPHFKSKYKNPVKSIHESDHKGFCLGYDFLKFPKLGKIPCKVHRPLQGKQKTCTIVKDGDKWFACIVVEIDHTPEPRPEPKIGIDLGITNFYADSNGNLAENPKFLDAEYKKLRRAQRIQARRVKGSSNRAKTNKRIARVHQKIRFKRDHFLHAEANKLTKSHGTVVVEDLNVSSMMRVRGGLSRQIGQVCWGRFREFLKYKLEWSGGRLEKVDPKYTSQSCSNCNHVDSASRSGINFQCTACGFKLHADTNAAINILSRASCPVLPVEGSSEVHIPMKQETSYPKFQGMTDLA